MFDSREAWPRDEHLRDTEGIRVSELLFAYVCVWVCVCVRATLLSIHVYIQLWISLYSFVTAFSVLATELGPRDTKINTQGSLSSRRSNLVKEKRKEINK